MAGPAVADNRCVHPVCGTDPYAEKGYRTPENPVWLRQYGGDGSARPDPDKAAGRGRLDSPGQMA